MSNSPNGVWLRNHLINVSCFINVVLLLVICKPGFSCWKPPTVVPTPSTPLVWDPMDGHPRCLHLLLALPDSFLGPRPLSPCLHRLWTVSTFRLGAGSFPGKVLAQSGCSLMSAKERTIVIWLLIRPTASSRPGDRAKLSIDPVPGPHHGYTRGIRLALPFEGYD